MKWRILHATLNDKPVNSTHWSTRALSEHLGVGTTTIRASGKATDRSLI